MNNATFAGRLGRDAETRNTSSTTVTGFSLAVDERRGGEKTTLWIDCSLWGERGEKVAQYLTKGTPVAVAGQVGVRTYEAHGETKAVITLNVRELTLLGSAQDGGERPARTSQPQQQRSAPAQSSTPPRQATPPADFSDDDIPF